MIFLKYAGVFVGTYLAVGLVLMFVIGPGSGAIGIFAAIGAVIYYRIRRKTRAADEFAETFAEAFISETRKLDLESGQTDLVNKWGCPACKTTNLSEAKFCMSCGEER